MKAHLILTASLCTLLPSVFLSQHAQAANGTWLGTGPDGLWNDPADWVNGVIPGVADGTTVNTDTAFFNTNPPHTTVTVDPNRNLENITFDTGAGSYTIGGAGANAGNSLLLTSGGAISILSTLTSTNAVETFNAPLVLEGVTGYSFVNNSANGAGAGAGTLNFAGNITGGAAGATTLTLDGSNTNANTISGVIADGSGGSVSVNKTGAGTWVLTAGNTFSGTTTVSGGVLQFGNNTNNNAGVAGAITLNGGTLRFFYNNGNFGSNNPITLTADSTIGNFGPQVNQNGTLTGNGHVLTIDNGTSTSPFYLQGGAGGTAPSQVNVVNGILGQTGGTLGGAPIAVSAGAELLTYGNPTLSSPVTLNGGAGPNGGGALETQGGGGGATFTGQITLNSGNTSIGVDDGNASLNAQGNFTGTGNLVKIGGGALVISQPNYSGTTTINAGRVTFLASVNSNTIAIASGAVAEFNTSQGDINSNNNTFTGTGTLLKSGSGYLQWQQPIATFALSPGALIDVEGGTFVGGSFGNENWTNNQSGLNVASGATFTGVEADVRVDALTGAGSVLGGYGGQGSVTIGVANGSGTFGGVLADSRQNGGVLTLIKTGTGTQVLTGVNTYSGSTTINGGTLQIGDGTSGNDGGLANTSGVTNNATLSFNLNGAQTAAYVISGTGNLTKNGGGMLTLSGQNTYSGTTSVNAGTLIISGSLTASSALNVSSTGSLTLQNSTALPSTMVLSLLSSTTNQTGSVVNLNYSGSDSISELLLDGQTVAPGTYSSSNLDSIESNQGGDISFTGSGDLTIAVPEPSTWAGGILLSGLLVVQRFLQRRKRAAGIA